MWELQQEREDSRHHTLIALCAGLGLAVLVGLFSAEHDLLPLIAIAAASSSPLIFLLLKSNSYVTRSTVVEATLALAIISLGVVFQEPAPFDMFIVASAGLGILYFSLRFPKVPASSHFLALSALFAVSQAMSLLKSPWPTTGLMYAAVTLLLVLAAVLIFSIAWQGGIGAEILIRCYVFGATATTLVAMVLVTAQIQTPFPLMYDELRFQSFYKDPNVLSPYLVVAFMLNLAMLAQRTGLSKFLGIASFLVLGTGILWAYSRAGWANWAVALVLYWLVMALLTKGLFLKSLLILLVIVPSAYFVLSSIDLPADSLPTQRLQLQGYDEQRFATQEEGLDLFWDSPLIGHGPGSSNELLPRATHNAYIRILLENGVFGFLAFVTLLLGAMVTSLRAAIRARRVDQRRIAAALFACLVGVAINSVVIDTIHWRHLWILISLGWASGCWVSTRFRSVSRR